MGLFLVEIQRTQIKKEGKMSEGLREAMWRKWGQDEKDGKLKAGDAIWGVSPGYDLIPEIDLPLNHYTSLMALIHVRLFLPWAYSSTGQEDAPMD